MIENVIYFLIGIKTFEISAYVKIGIFTKIVNNFETLRQIFLFFRFSIYFIRNLRRIQFAIQEEQLYAECGARLNNFDLSKSLCISPSLFAKKSQRSTI